MSRYIDADLAKSKIEERLLFRAKDVERLLDDIPTADVVPKKQYDMLLERFRHLLESPYIRSFDEWDARHMRYKRDIKEADERAERHGHWIPIRKRLYACNDPIGEICTVGYTCSECGHEEDYEAPYCNCGAKMDRKENTDADTV